MFITYCVLDLCRILFKNVISFKPSHYLNEIGIIITEEETGSESLSKPPKGCWVVRARILKKQHENRDFRLAT